MPMLSKADERAKIGATVARRFDGGVLAVLVLAVLGLDIAQHSA
jgi:hypothetical protein